MFQFTYIYVHFLSAGHSAPLTIECNHCDQNQHFKKIVLKKKNCLSIIKDVYYFRMSYIFGQKIVNP